MRWKKEPGGRHDAETHREQTNTMRRSELTSIKALQKQNVKLKTVHTGLRPARLSLNWKFKVHRRNKLRLAVLLSAQFQASDSSLLSRLISICSDGRLSSRLFFILWDIRSCFCLIMAPHILCSVESSSSSSCFSSTSSSRSLRLLPTLLPTATLSLRPDDDVEEEKIPPEWPLGLRS